MVSKMLRLITYLLLGLTFVFHLLGAVGSSCVALGLVVPPSMEPLEPYQWLYQLFVVVTLTLSIYGIWATIGLARGKQGALRHVWIALIATLVVSGIHMYASETLRGSSAPTNMRVYFTILTLLVMLLLLLPPIRERVNFSAGSQSSPTDAVGSAMILAGVLTLTVQYWAGPSHLMNGGINYADAWHDTLLIVGGFLVFSGFGLFVRSTWINYTHSKVTFLSQMRSKA